MQTIIQEKNAHTKIGEILKNYGSKKIMLVGGTTFYDSPIKSYFDNVGIPYVFFNDFCPNPSYEDILNGVTLFREENCDALVAIGGGSALDVAKCIKAFSKMDGSGNYIDQPVFDTKIPLIALPTTAGTGSESTRFAVFYYKGEKQSLSHESLIPDVAVLQSETLLTLPEYQKKCTLLDALCQAVESWWSVNSTAESISYAKQAVEDILRYYRPYIFENSPSAADKIMLASNLAGRAINITATTAPHAMSYKLTTLYGIPHGHAVALGLAKVWRYMLSHTQDCTDNRGKEYLEDIFGQIIKVFGTPDDFDALLSELEIFGPFAMDAEKELDILSSSVNAERLGNNPVKLSREVLYNMYKGILRNDS